MKSSESPKEIENIALKTDKPTALPIKKTSENIRSAETTTISEEEPTETAETQKEIVPQNSPSSGEIRDNIIEDKQDSKQATSDQSQSTYDQDQISSPTPARDGDLSMFWIVILIILLLWLLGFVLNIGALVHLLLVVALILLILWLLGII
jgi:Flp pilus assembly protein TadB